MGYKMIWGLLIIAIFSLFTACANEKTEKTETLADINKTQQAVSISKNEFDVNYNGGIINVDIPFETIAKELGINIVTYGGISDSRTENYAANTPYSWNMVHYPSKENEEIRIEYVYNEEAGESYIVRIELHGDVKTYRDIQIGDSLDKFLEAYSGLIYANGDDTDKSWYYYIGDGSNKVDYSGMCVTVGKISKKVEEIWIDYNITKARDEMQLWGD